MNDRATMRERASRLWRGLARRLRVLALLALALCGCAYTLVSGGAVNQTKADQVEAGIQQFRQLQFTAPVPLVIKTRNQAEAMLAAEITHDHTDEQMRIGSVTGAMTGIYPRGLDLKTETLKLLRKQIAGFYDPHTGQMVLVEGAADVSLWRSAASFVARRDVVGEMLLAHELTHALQGQHFAIEQMLNQVKDNDDRDLALKAVAEGDATLAGFGYVTGRLDNPTIDLIETRMDDLPRTFAAQSGDVPIGLSAPMIFQYAAGTRFVATAYRRGGWAAVDALYADPPQSTLEILEPDRYFDRRTPPNAIDLSGYQPFLDGWTKVDDDTYGALLLKVIIERNLGMDAPQLALVDHWAGDRMITLQKGRALTIVWMLSFRDAASAEQFGAAYSGILTSILGRGTAHRVAVVAPNVLVMIGDGANQFDRLAPAVWKASTIIHPTAPRHRPTAPLTTSALPSGARPILATTH